MFLERYTDAEAGSDRRLFVRTGINLLGRDGREVRVELYRFWAGAIMVRLESSLPTFAFKDVLDITPPQRAGEVPTLHLNCWKISPYTAPAKNSGAKGRTRGTAARVHSKLPSWMLHDPPPQREERQAKKKVPQKAWTLEELEEELAAHGA